VGEPGRHSAERPCSLRCWPQGIGLEERIMNNIIYIVGLVVVVLAVLAFFGLR
jgi:hypothetical protein